jgi:hypothetical protein
MQGFFYALPMPVEILRDWWRNPAGLEELYRGAPPAGHAGIARARASLPSNAED